MPTVAPGRHLPPLPPGFSGEFLTAPDRITPWAGASGPFWRPPRGVLLPRSVPDVALAVRWAAEHGLALVPRGGGTGMPGGNVAPEVVLDLTGLETIQLDPGAPGVVRAGAGARAAAVREVVEAGGRTMPALPSSAPWCSAGGIAACNAAGARSFSLGAAHAWIGAVEWVRADGSIERLERGAAPAPGWRELRHRLAGALPSPLPWPRVRKNSSGYALDRFLSSGDPVDLAVGSEGTLGVITAVTFRTHAAPEKVAVALLGVPEVGVLGEMASASHRIPAVQACEYFGARLLAMGGAGDDPRLDGMEAGGGLLLFEFAGTEDEVSEGLAGARELAARAGGLTVATEAEAMEDLWEFRHAASPSLARALAQGRRSTQFIEDSVVPVSRLHDYVTGLEEILARHETDAAIFGHAGDGNLHVNPLVELGRGDWRSRVRRILDDTVELVAGLGGTLAGEHGDGRLRTPYLPRFFHPAVIQAFARVKSAFDPDGILNPGVIVPDPRRQGSPDVDPLAGLGEAPGFAEGTQGPERDRQR